MQEALINVHLHAGSSRASIRLRRTSDSLTLEVEDCGRGLPATVLTQLPAGGGALGVGVAGMRERLQQLGGTLEIDSDRERDDRARARPARRASGVTLTPLRIVVVDDHAVVRRGVRALLESRTGWEVVAEATTGREALDAVKRHRPEIVVMDISLPELNGLEATRQIVLESPQTEVLVLTMHHSEELAREVLKAGARGYVLKSDADESLIAAVDALRRHKPFLTSGVTEFMLDGFLRDMSAPDLCTKDSVTPREREIIQLLTEGQSNKEAAARLGISVKTIEAHRANIMRKLRLRSVTDSYATQSATRSRSRDLPKHPRTPAPAAAA